jgi:hypothetical protein
MFITPASGESLDEILSKYPEGEDSARFCQTHGRTTMLTGRVGGCEEGSNRHFRNDFANIFQKSWKSV